MFEKELNEELSGVETALKDLKPASSGIQRDRLMFLAGQASMANVTVARGPSPAAARFWQFVTAASLLTAFVMGSLWMHDGEPQVIERVVHVPSAPSANTGDLQAAKAFANWQPAPLMGSRNKRIGAQPKNHFDRRSPGSS